MRHHPFNDKASLSGIRRAIRADLGGADADPSLSFDCLVAVTEACTNALMHGPAGSGGHSPVVSWMVDGAVATFCIEDFSAERWAMSRHPSRSVDSVKVDLGSDLGLSLMRDLMDEVVVDSVPQGTIVTLTKNLLRP